jgi:hypothetical protein
MMISNEKKKNTHGNIPSQCHPVHFKCNINFLGFNPVLRGKRSATSSHEQILDTDDNTCIAGDKDIFLP